jgi:hypothetical protein
LNSVEEDERKRTFPAPRKGARTRREEMMKMMRGGREPGGERIYTVNEYTR